MTPWAFVAIVTFALACALIIVEWRTEEQERLILEILEPGVELYVREILLQCDGRISAGALYWLLSRLEDRGLIKSRPETLTRGQLAAGLPPRRLYRRWM